MQLKPVGKLAGTVIVTGLLLEQTIIVPLSDVLPKFLRSQIPSEHHTYPVNGLSLKSAFPVPFGSTVIFPFAPSVIVIDPVVEFPV